MSGTSPASVADATERLLVAIEARTGRARKRAGREWRVLCPAHEDSDPSLDIREGDGGYPIMACRSHGCEPDRILEAVGLVWADLLGGEDERWTPRGPWTALYEYVDEEGKVLFQVCRTAAKEFPQRHPNPEKRNGWEWNLNGTRRVPFRLPGLIAAAAVGEVVYVAEGEKDVLALERVGMVATCNPGGAGKWKHEYGAYFAGTNAIVVVDNDVAGRKHALAVHRSLEATAASVRLIRAKEGKDAADHLARYSVDEFDALTLSELEIAVAQDAAPDAQASVETGDAAAEGAPRLRFLGGREFIAQPLAKIDPLFGTQGDALMMPGSLMLLAGIGGAGKTTLSMHMLAHWSAGLPWFGIEVARPIRVVVVENEGPHDPFVMKVKEFSERFKGCTCSGEPHGDSGFLDNCLFLDAPWGHFGFDDPGLAAELRDIVVDFSGDLVVANPLGRLGMKGAGTPEETREFLQLLTNAGLGEDFAALLLHHLAKVAKGTPLVQQVSGDWGPHPDTIMVMESAGERRSKLSFGKIRWGDQGRSPLILNWLTDPKGPIGYVAADAPQGVPEDELYRRIDTFLREQAAPVGITSIAQGVTGQNKRIRELVDQGTASGRYGSSGGARPTYWLLPPGSTPTVQETLEL